MNHTKPNKKVQLSQIKCIVKYIYFMIVLSRNVTTSKDAKSWEPSPLQALNFSQNRQFRSSSKSRLEVRQNNRVLVNTNHTALNNTMLLHNTLHSSA